MGYIDNTLVTIDAIVTQRGRELLSTGRGKFKVTKFAVADDEVDYRLWDNNNTNGSIYYGQVIENMSLIEANPNQDKTMNFKMLSLPKNIGVVPVMTILGGNYSPIINENSGFYPFAPTLSLTPITSNPSDANSNFGYTAIVSDADVLRIQGVGGKVSGGTINGQFEIDPVTGNRTIKATGDYFMIDPNQGFHINTNAQKASITIIGNEIPGKLLINVTVIGYIPPSYPSFPSGNQPSQTGAPPITMGSFGYQSTNPQGGGCFAAGGKVITKKRGIVNIEDLKIGEKVQTEKGWSRIWGYQTYSHNIEIDFVVIKHAKGQIKLSTLHYIYVNNKPIFAKDVKVGDKIKYKGKYIKISEVFSKRSKGVYSPMTTNGRINVNDIDCSIYTDVPFILTYSLSKIARIIFLLFPKERYKYFNMKPVNKESKQLLQGMHKWMYIFGRLTGVTDKAKIEERLTLEELRNEKK